MNFFKGLTRPVRLAGVVLIGVALVAVVIGIVTTVHGSPVQTAAPSTSASAAPSGPAEPTRPAPSSAPGSATGAPATPSLPPAGTTPPPNTPGGQTDAKWVAVRVYNNSTIKGLAARAAGDFRADGWNITESGNYPYGIIPTTTAYFTPGTDEETAAKALAARFGMKAEPRFEGIQDSSPGVIVIVTNDYQGLHTKDG